MNLASRVRSTLENMRKFYLAPGNRVNRPSNLGLVKGLKLKEKIIPIDFN